MLTSRSTTPRVATLLALGIFAVCLPSVVGAQSASADDGRFKQGELLVGFRSVGVSAMALEESRLSTKPFIASVLGRIPEIGVLRVQVASGHNLDRVAARMRSLPEVAYVEKNRVRHIFAGSNDPGYSQQYALPAIQVDKAWEIWKPRSQVIVAFIDTGIDYTHPDLTNNILRNDGQVVGYNCSGGNAISHDPSDPLDDHGHGTMTAGIVGAQTNNWIGIAGIAGWSNDPASPGSSLVKLMPVKVADNTGTALVSNEADGIVWAANHGAKIINLSIGSATATSTEKNAIDYASAHGCVLIAAAGNDGSSTPQYPAAYGNVLSVAATDQNNTLANFSNYGPWVDCAAPGVEIISTFPTYKTSYDFTDYAVGTGTSMSTAIVSGEAALLVSQNAHLTPMQVYRCILNSAETFTPYSGRTISGGRVNAYKSLRAVISAGPVVDFNGDGWSDLLVMNKSTRQLAVLLLSGAKVTSSYSLTPALPTGWLVGGTADFLGNGTVSIAVQNLATQQISILGVTGRYVTSSTPLKPSMLPNWEIRCAADIDGDGQPDLVAQNTITRDISALIVKDLKITASIPIRPTLPVGWKLVGARDVDGDGSTDLVVHHPSTGQTATLFLNGTTIRASVSLTPNLALGWNVQAVGDMDWSGTPEVFAQHPVTRQILALMLTGTKYTGSYTILPILPAGWELVGPR